MHMWELPRKVRKFDKHQKVAILLSELLLHYYSQAICTYCHLITVSEHRLLSLYSVIKLVSSLML